MGEGRGGKGERETQRHTHGAALDTHTHTTGVGTADLRAGGRRALCESGPPCHAVRPVWEGGRRGGWDGPQPALLSWWGLPAYLVVRRGCGWPVNARPRASPRGAATTTTTCVCVGGREWAGLRLRRGRARTLDSDGLSVPPAARTTRPLSASSSGPGSSGGVGEVGVGVLEVASGRRGRGGEARDRLTV